MSALAQVMPANNVIDLPRTTAAAEMIERVQRYAAGLSDYDAVLQAVAIRSRYGVDLSWYDQLKHGADAREQARFWAAVTICRDDVYVVRLEDTRVMVAPYWTGV